MFPDRSYANDSSHVILELEARHPLHRSVVPASAALAFVAALLEDFADEWLTKVMFEGRFHTEEDAEFGASWQLQQVLYQSSLPSGPGTQATLT